MRRVTLTHPDTGDSVSVTPAGAEALRERGYVSAGADDRPAESALKAEWVAYALTQGIEDAELLTKAELIERSGE